MRSLRFILSNTILHATFIYMRLIAEKCFMQKNHLLFIPPYQDHMIFMHWQIYTYMHIVISNMAAVHCESKNNSPADLSKTALLSNEATKTIEEHEESGIQLQSAWTFWLGNAVTCTTLEEYKENLMKIYTVNTIQSFWAVFNNIPNASTLQLKHSYHLMRDERYPLWEEQANRNGGTWRLKCHKSDTDKVWKEIVLAAIGEQFAECMAENDDICGVTVTLKEREDVIQIWNTNAAVASNATVMDKVKSILPGLNFNKFYKPHQTHHAFGR